MSEQTTLCYSGISNDKGDRETAPTSSFNAGAIRLISPFALDETGASLRTMREQRELQRQAFDWSGDAAFSRKPFVIIGDGGVLGIPCFIGKPVIIRQRDVKHIYKRHAADGQVRLSYEEINEKLENLEEELLNHVFAFDDPCQVGHVCLVLGMMTRGGNELIAVADACATASSIDVVDIVTVHGRDDLFERIEQALEKRLRCYPNNRTGAWLESSAEHPRETIRHLLSQL